MNLQYVHNIMSMPTPKNVHKVNKILSTLYLYLQHTPAEVYRLTDKFAITWGTGILQRVKLLHEGLNINSKLLKILCFVSKTLELQITLPSNYIDP